MKTKVQEQVVLVTTRHLSGGWLRALYSALIICAVPVIYAYLWWHGRNNQAYRKRWAERGAWQSVPANVRRCVVFHCVSVGELMAARPLIEQFIQLNPHQPVAITTTTPTGSDLVRSIFGERVYHCYLPFDTPLAVRRFINRLRPRAIIILETELWPNLISQCYQANIRLMLLNARMSERSARGYQRARALMRPIWQALDGVVAQDNASAERFIQLGCLAERVHVPGNIKFDVQVNSSTKQAIDGFKPLLNGRQVITFGSTHEGEETIALAAFKQVLKSKPQALLILVPRHRERFDSVAQMVEDSGLRMVRRSSGRPVTPDTQVLLADSMGEMLLWFGVSTLATIGGSLIERGGHNPLEAMAFGLPIVSGRHVFNFEDVYRQLDARQAVRWVSNEDQLRDTWLGLLVETGTAQRIGAQAQQLFARHRGATQRTLTLIAQTMAAGSSGRTQGELATMRFDQALVTQQPQQQHFNVEFWQRLGQQHGHAGGRNLAYFIQAENALSPLPMVLRHYYRGGLVGKVNRDWFLHAGSKPARSIAEFELLQWMYQQGLPVPRPIAARVHKVALWYRADILIERLPCDDDVFGRLKQAPLQEAVWFKIGQTIRQMHDHGVYHSDLNCHNILVREATQDVWLIDFDKCERRNKDQSAGEWQQSNLDRLRRSFDKESGLHQGFHFSDQDWQQLMQGYQTGKASTPQQPPIEPEGSA